MPNLTVVEPAAPGMSREALLAARPCVQPGVDPEWWTPLVERPEEAAALCAGCPLQAREECLRTSYALAETTGYWGGMTGAARLKALRGDRGLVDEGLAARTRSNDGYVHMRDGRRVTHPMARATGTWRAA